MSQVDADLSLLFDRSPIGIYRTRRDGTFLYVNPALAQMLGYTVEELLAKNLNRDIYIDPAARENLILHYIPHGWMDGARAEWRAKDGRTLIVNIWGHYFDSDAGRSFDAWIIDVTEEEARKQELQRQREDLARTARTLELVVRQMPVVYWIVDREFRIILGGGASEDVVGKPAESTVGTTLQDLQRGEPVPDPVENHRRALAGEHVSYDREFRGKQLQVTVGPYRAADGSIAGVIGTAIDVTAARQLERRLVDAQRAESLGVLAGGLAHDFNNLLVAVLGNADLALREIPPGTPGRAAIENIRDAGLRAAELTDQLLAYAGRGGVGTTRVEPAAIVDELVRITAPSIPPHIKVTVDVPGNLPVRADPSQIRQVVLNLITNARDAIGERSGSLAISAQHVHHDGRADPDDVLLAPAGGYVAIDVVDDGPGMDPQIRRHVFEPFFTTKRSGHGLGLAAVLGIVRAHGGGLRLTTGPGRGAHFRVLWPAAATAPLRAPPVTPALRTVLVIDDEDLVRDVVARMVEDLGYTALTAADGQSGLDLVERADAVLVDLTMPRMNGAEVIAQIRTLRPGLPVVLCSGYDRDGRGPVTADAYLPKPFRIDALEKTLAKLLP